MNKKGIEFQTLIMMIIMAFIMVIFITSIFPVFQQKAEAAIEKGKCELTVLLAALVQTGSAGTVEVPPACKMRDVTITEEDINNKLPYARKRFAVYGDKKYENFLKIFTPSNQTTTEKEFALDNIIAEELDNCWDKVIKGKLPIYSKPFFEGSVNCIICSEIKFDDDVIRQFGGRKITSLPEWMKINPLPNTNIPYWEYIIDGQTGVTGLAQPQYDFEVSKTPLAVIFVNIRKSHADTLVGDLFTEKPATDVNVLKIVPFTQESIRGEVKCDPNKEIK